MPWQPEGARTSPRKSQGPQLYPLPPARRLSLTSPPAHTRKNLPRHAPGETPSQLGTPRTVWPTLMAKLITYYFRPQILCHKEVNRLSAHGHGFLCRQPGWTPSPLPKHEHPPKPPPAALHRRPLPPAAQAPWSPCAHLTAHVLPQHSCHLSASAFLFFSFFVFLGLHPRHMDVPKLGGKAELQLPACTTATATPNPSPTATYTTARSNTGSLTQGARPHLHAHR